MPERIQRKRAKGWRMPEGAVYVGRPSRWGNPFTVGALIRTPGFWKAPCSHLVSSYQGPGEYGAYDIASEPYTYTVREVVSVADSIALFRSYVAFEWDTDHVRAGLRGRDLACWCPLDQPCHADVLLELANR